MPEMKTMTGEELFRMMVDIIFPDMCESGRKAVYNGFGMWLWEHKDQSNTMVSILKEGIKPSHNYFAISADGDIARTPLVKWMFSIMEAMRYSRSKCSDTNGVVLIFNTVIHLKHRYPNADDVLKRMVAAEFGGMDHTMCVVIAVDHHPVGFAKYQTYWQLHSTGIKPLPSRPITPTSTSFYNGWITRPRVVM
jgi:hypothetical protein